MTFDKLWVSKVKWSNIKVKQTDFSRLLVLGLYVFFQCSLDVDELEVVA